MSAILEAADWMHDYTPTAEAVAINQNRIEERLS